MNNLSALCLRTHAYSYFTIPAKHLTVPDALQQRDCTVVVTVIHTHLTSAERRALEHVERFSWALCSWIKRGTRTAY